jgi:pSer/pThr/pTyr-binding forkhead associated (FHA) protein
VIRNPAVSQVHGCFMEHDGRYLLIDAKSKNGTEIEGVRLGSLGRAPLEDGATLRFGEAVTVLFCSTHQLCELLQSPGAGTA